MRFRTAPIALPLAIMLTTFLGSPSALAQKLDVRYEPIGKTVNLDADDADVRQVVRQMLTAASISRYEMEPGIDSKVTLTLRNTPFERALQTVLARAGAEHDYDNGLLRIYRAGNRPAPGESPSRGSGGDRTGRDRTGRDRGTGGERGSGTGYRPGSAVPAAFLTKVSLRMEDSPIATVMANLSRLSGVRVTATREVPLDLRVTLVAGNDPLWNVLQRIAQASRLKVEITGDREATFSPLTSVRTRDRDGRVGSSVGAALCRHCRYELRSEWRYCPMCGERTDR